MKMTEDFGKKTEPASVVEENSGLSTTANDIENLLHVIDESLDELRDKVDDRSHAVPVNQAGSEAEDRPVAETQEERIDTTQTDKLNTDTGSIDDLLADLADELIEEEAKPAPSAASLPRPENALAVGVDQESIEETEKEIDSLLADMETSLEASPPDSAGSESVGGGTAAVSPAALPVESESEPPASGDIDSLLDSLTAEMDNLNAETAIPDATAPSSGPEPEIAQAAAAVASPAASASASAPAQAADPLQTIEAEEEVKLPASGKTGSPLPIPPMEEKQILEEAPTTDTPAGESEHLPAPGPDAGPSLPMPMPARMLVYSLTTINKPFGFLSDTVRDTLGIVGICTCLICLILMAVIILA